jgi:hypothetical protein
MVDLAGHTVSRVPLVKHQADDHDTPGMLWEPDQPPLIMNGDHGRTAYLEQWTGPSPQTFGPFTATSVNTAGETPSYPELIRRPGTSSVVAIWRGRSLSGQYASQSTDWGTTWGAPVNLWGYLEYATHKISADGRTAWFAEARNPADTLNEIRVWKADLATGAISNAAGTKTSPQILWAPSGPVSSGLMDRPVLPLAAGSWLRLFDISSNGDILFARWNDGDATVSYRLLTRSGSTWTESTLCDGGVPFGYITAHYVGGASFDGGADNILLCREAGGTWTLERWRRGTTWSTDVLLTRTDGRKLARPIVPRGSEGLGYVLVLDIHSYSATSYTSYLADARLVRDLGATNA